MKPDQVAIPRLRCTCGARLLYCGWYLRGDRTDPCSRVYVGTCRDLIGDVARCQVSVGWGAAFFRPSSRPNLHHPSSLSTTMSDVVELANMSGYDTVEGQLLGDDDGFLECVTSLHEFVAD